MPDAESFEAIEGITCSDDSIITVSGYVNDEISDIVAGVKGVVNLVGVNVAVEIAAEGETVVGVVLSNARKGVVGTALCGLEVVLGASVVARHTSPTLALPRRKPLGTTSAKRHTLATHLLPLARQVVEVRGTAK